MYSLLFAVGSNNTSWYDVFKNQILNELEIKYSVRVLTLTDYPSITVYRESLISILSSQDRPHVFFTTFSDSVIDKQTIEVVKTYSKTCLLLMDNLQLPFKHLRIAKYYDLVWAFDSNTLRFLSKYKINYIHMPWANNPNLYTTYDGVIKPKVLYVGSTYGARKKLIWEIANYGFEIDVYNNYHSVNEKKVIEKNRFKQSKQLEIINSIKTFLQYLRFEEGRKIILSRLIWYFLDRKYDIYNNPRICFFEPVEYDDLSELFQSYRMVLTSNKLRSTSLLKYPVSHLTLKNFEITGLGGLMLAEEDIETNKYYNNNQIVKFNKKNLVTNLNYFLKIATTDQIVETRNSTSDYVRANHNWVNRFGKLIETLRIKD
jgi:hypothetical protein